MSRHVDHGHCLLDTLDFSILFFEWPTLWGCRSFQFWTSWSVKWRWNSLPNLMGNWCCSGIRSTATWIACGFASWVNLVTPGLFHKRDRGQEHRQPWAGWRGHLSSTVLQRNLQNHAVWKQLTRIKAFKPLRNTFLVQVSVPVLWLYTLWIFVAYNQEISKLTPNLWTSVVQSTAPVRKSLPGSSDMF